MKTALEFALLGLGAGAVYAMLAQGLVLIFRGSGVLNLAHGAFAMVAGFLFHSLYTNRGWPLGLAMAATIVTVAVVGVATDQVLLRHLRGASPLTRLIATLGVLLLLQSVAYLLWGQIPITVLPIIHTHVVFLLGLTVPSDTLWLLCIAFVTTCALSLLWRCTRAGWIAEAVSENQQAASSLGWSPELVSAVTWGGGAALAAAAGILVTPITQLDVENLTLLVIAALAAALLGGLRSFWITLVGGLVIGVLQSEVSNYVTVVGAADAIPFLLVIAILTFRGSALPLRGHVSDRLPWVGSGRVHPRVLVVVVGLVAGAFVIFTSATLWAAVASTAGVAVVLLSLVVLTGYAGQVSLAQYALAGLGALFAAHLSATEHWSFLGASAVGIIGAASVGVVFALPALRSRGVNLAVVTLGLGLVINSMIFNNLEYAGGVGGIEVPAPTLFGWSLNPFTHAARYAMFAVGVLLLAALLVARLRRGRLGRRLLAVRSNENAAAAAGISVFRAKLFAFALAGALAGLGGIVMSFGEPSVSFGSFDPLGSLYVVAWAVIGGIGAIGGTVFGATFSPASFGSLIALRWQGLDVWLPIVGAVAVIVTVVVHRDGWVKQALVPGRWVARSLRLIRDDPYPTFPEAGPIRVAPRQFRAHHVTVRYGGHVAVDDVSIAVSPGEVVGLIGPNGAGKTSLLDAVSGFTPMEGNGAVTLGDARVDSWSPHRRAYAGIVRTFQGMELFADLTVLEHLRVATERWDKRPPWRRVVRPEHAEIAPAAASAIRAFGLVESLRSYPDELSYGTRRLLAIARAVAMEPSVLLLDEPVAGLSDHETATFATLVRRLADEWGMAILIVEHDMSFVMGLCDRLIVLDFGKAIAEGRPSAIRDNPAAIAAYLGEESPVAAEEQRKGSQSAFAR